MNLILTPYDRDAAVRYAHAWAFARNPLFYDYDLLGGDCTNFASQCLYAGSGVMNYTPTFGWYYFDANDKSPSWTGVVYLADFLTRGALNVGPAARETALEEAEPGDVIQLSFDGYRYQHTQIVVSAGEPRTPENVLVAAHSVDSDYRPLTTYDYQKLRCLHLLGVYRNE